MLPCKSCTTQKWGRTPFNSHTEHKLGTEHCTVFNMGQNTALQQPCRSWITQIRNRILSQPSQSRRTQRWCRTLYCNSNVSHKEHKPGTDRCVFNSHICHTEKQERARPLYCNSCICHPSHKSVTDYCIALTTSVTQSTNKVLLTEVDNGLTLHTSTPRRLALNPSW